MSYEVRDLTANSNGTLSSHLAVKDRASSLRERLWHGSLAHTADYHVGKEQLIHRLGVITIRYNKRQLFKQGDLVYEMPDYVAYWPSGFRVHLRNIWRLLTYRQYKDVHAYVGWWWRGWPALCIWGAAEYLEILKKKQHKHATENKTRHKATMKALAEVDARKTGDIWDDYFLGVHRASLLILDNLGISIDVTLGLMIYVLENNMPTFEVDYLTQKHIIQQQAMMLLDEEAEE